MTPGLAGYGCGRDEDDEDSSDDGDSDGVTVGGGVGEAEVPLVAARGRDATSGRSLLSKVCCCKLARGRPYGHRATGR